MHSGLRRAGWNAEGPGLFLMVCGVVLGLLLTGGWPGAGRCQSPGPRLPHPQVKKADYTLVSICCSMIPSQGSRKNNKCNTVLASTAWRDRNRQAGPSFYLYSTCFSVLAAGLGHRGCPVRLPPWFPTWHSPTAGDQ